MSIAELEKMKLLTLLTAAPLVHKPWLGCLLCVALLLTLSLHAQTPNYSICSSSTSSPAFTTFYRKFTSNTSLGPNDFSVQHHVYTFFNKYFQHSTTDHITQDVQDVLQGILLVWPLGSLPE